MMAGVFRENVVDAEVFAVRQEQFCDLLRRAGIFDGQARTNQEREERSENQDQNAHADVLGNRKIGMVRLDV